jgi:pimeloyl-ACP methyl ester carboxylesterase
VDLDPALDTDRVIVVGHSAGGHLAVWTAHRAALPDGAPPPRGAPPAARPEAGPAVAADAGEGVVRLRLGVRYVEVPAAGHFDVIDPDGVAWAAVRTWLGERLAPAIETPPATHSRAAR